ncbi:MAG: hypothetical protein M3008_01570, partial [Chloroflexota bacterium]|nr:hypothetical protein [Chloroflexota bacterium]
QKSDAQWIEVFAHSFVTQRHLMVKTRGVTAKEGTVTQINPDSVHAVGIHDAGHQIPFGGIEKMTRLGEAEMPLGPLATRHSYEFAGFMARGEQLRIETADDLIAKAAVRQITLAGVWVADTFDGVGVSVPYEDITDILSVGME